MGQGRQGETNYGFEKASGRGYTSGKAVGNYEDLVSEMKRITGF